MMWPYPHPIFDLICGKNPEPKLYYLLTYIIHLTSIANNNKMDVYKILVIGDQKTGKSSLI
jgi:GTPase SAR1 family protein